MVFSTQTKCADNLEKAIWLVWFAVRGLNLLFVLTTFGFDLETGNGRHFYSWLEYHGVYPYLIFSYISKTNIQPLK